MTDLSKNPPRVYDAEELRVAAERELGSLSETGYGRSRNYAFGNAAAFLAHVLNEDETAAQACDEVYPSPWELSDRGWMAKVQADAPVFRIVAEIEQHPEIEGWLGDRLDHIARHDPASALARIAADRQILALHEGGVSYPEDCGICNETLPCATIRLLALPYADRPGYREEWKP